MISSQQKRSLVTLTGIPGVGKSTWGRLLADNLIGNGLTAEFVDEYEFMREYAQFHREEPELVTWGARGFTLTPEAYNYVTAYSSRGVAEAARRLFLENDINVVLYEGARGAFGVDNYRDHFFRPTLEILSEIGGFQIANIEVSIRDIAENRRRMLSRFEDSDGVTAVPPPWILERYIDESTGVPWVNPVEALSSLDLEGVVIMNRTVFNDGDFAQIEREVELIARELCGRSGLMEGANGGGVEGKL